MSYCRTCGEEIARGTNYCRIHYFKALEKYESDMESYRINKAAWEKLSDTEKEQAHEQANNENLQGYSVVVFFATGLAVWYILHKFYKIDALIGIAVAIFSIFIGQIDFLAKTIGRLTRTIAYSILYSLGIAIFIYPLTLISNFAEKHKYIFIAAIPILGIALSISNEKDGTHKSSAEPSPPTKPRR